MRSNQAKGGLVNGGASARPLERGFRGACRGPHENLARPEIGRKPISGYALVKSMDPHPHQPSSPSSELVSELVHATLGEITQEILRELYATARIRLMLNGHRDARDAIDRDLNHASAAPRDPAIYKSYLDTVLRYAETGKESRCGNLAMYFFPYYATDYLPERKELFKRGFEQVVKKGEDVELFLDGFSRFYNMHFERLQEILSPQFSAQEQWQIFREGLETLLKENLPVAQFTQLAGSMPLSPLAMQLYTETQIFCLRRDFDSTQMHWLGRLFDQVRVSDQYARNYLKSLAQGEFTTVDEVREALAEVFSLECRRTICSSAPKEQRAIARGMHEDYFGNIIPRESRQAVLGDVVTLQKRSLDIAAGFSAQLFETKWLPIGGPPLVAQFGNELGEAFFINAEDRNRAPGRGFLIRNINPEKIFLPMSRDRWTEDSLSEYKEIWPDLADYFEDSKKTEHVLLRKGWATLYTGGDRYLHRNYAGKMIPYAHLIFNDHFENARCELEVLLPQAVLQQKLTGACIPYEEGTPYDSGYADVTTVGFTMQGLRRACEEYGAPLLDVGHGSRLSEGLGFATSSHDETVATLRGYHALRDIFRLEQAYWSKGYTESRFNLLDVCYDLHAGLRKRNAQHSDFPVLCDADPLCMSKIPDSIFVLDTYDLSMQLKNSWQRFENLWPRPGTEVREFWNNEVLPSLEAQPTIRGLRFYSRKTLNL